jgi:hypothetical protein
MEKWRRLTVLLVLMMAGIFPRAVGAQAGRGRLMVTVTDSTGAVLPNADVRLTGLENATRATSVPTVKTVDSGVATFTGLLPGRYSIEAEFPGFDKGIVKEYRVRAGDNRQTLVLPLRGVSDTVTVGRDGQEAAADRGVTFGTALTREQIDALSDDPNEMRQQLLDMAGPGATINVDSFEGGQLPPKSQIRSIRIARDQFAAENHSAGIGRIEIVTQPGIGPLRGGVSTNFFDSALDGKNPLVRQTGAARNQSMSASLGGSLMREKMSFGLSVGAGSSYSTPVLTTATSSGSVNRNSTLRTPSDNRSMYGQVDYALSRDQTLRFNFNSNQFNSRNLGIGAYDELERAYSTTNLNRAIYLQQTGPIGRRLALNSRLSLNWSRQTSSSAVEQPTVVVTDAFTRGGAQRTGGTRTRALQLASDLDYVRGLHSVRVGILADIYNYRSDTNSNYLGTYTFESLEAFEAGQPRSYTRRIGDPNIRFTTSQVGVYVQDDIRVRRNLTLSPGLRYELQSNVPDRLNFAPRFGFTWAPFAHGRTTLRASAGVFYDWLAQGTYQQTLLIDGFHQQEVNLRNPTFPDPGSFGAAPPTNRYLIQGGLPMARTNRLSFGFAHTFNPRYSVNAVYSDMRTAQQLVGNNLNTPVNGVRPDPAFANIIEAVARGRSRQRTLNSSLSVNLAPPGPAAPSSGAFFSWRRALRMGVNYTLGSARNNTEGPFATPATGNLDEEWGPSPQDVRHRAGISFGTGAFRNVSANMQFSWSSAPPLTIRTGFDDNGDLIFNDRPLGVGRGTERTTGQFSSFAFFSYSIPLGGPTVQGPGGVMITSSGGGLVVAQSAPTATARYRLNIGVNIQNLTNHANLVGYSGVQSSPKFLQPSSAAGVRRITFNMGLSF